jgi:hypothetical protein
MSAALGGAVTISAEGDAEGRLAKSQAHGKSLGMKK